MSDFETRMKGHPWKRFESGQGEPVTFTKSGVAGVTINAVIDRDIRVETETNETGITRRRLCKLIVSSDDASDPNEHDTFTFDSLTWDIELSSGKNGMLEITVLNDSFTERRHEGNRRSS